MEDLQARHRKEQRDLQSRITQKKKQATKKTRKGVNDECERLETELKDRQNAEIAALTGEEVDATAAQLEDLSLVTDDRSLDATQDKAADDAASQPNGRAVGEDGSMDASRSKKPNRAKARLARRAAEQEEMVRQAAEEAKNLPDLKQQERERMLEAMKARGLQEKEIRADGHCLYSAVADQLEQLDLPVGTSPKTDTIIPVYKVVRRAAADYIDQHRADFEPFLEEPLPEYLHKVRDTGEWGGQLELMALAKTYAAKINVLQDFGRVETIEGDAADNKRVMWLGYYKHGFGLGEHYNSLRKGG